MLNRHPSLFVKPANKYEWINRLKETISETGANADIVDNISLAPNNHLIHDFEQLYRNFNNLMPAILSGLRAPITEEWELLCLSGEKDAFEYAVKCGMDKNTVNASGENPLHLSTLSAVPGQMHRALLLGIPCTSETKEGGSILLAAIASKNPQQLQAVLHVESNNRTKLAHTTKDGRTALHIAAFTGNPLMVEMVLEIAWEKGSGLDIQSVDTHGYNALNYAIKRGNQNVIRKLEQAGLTPNPNQECFPYGVQPLTIEPLQIKCS